MLAEFEAGDTASIVYTSKRSDNEVSRTGTVLQTPDEDGKRGFFLQTDDEQLTGVMDGRVYSITVGTEGDERAVRRKTYLGDLEAVSPA